MMNMGNDINNASNNTSNNANKQHLLKDMLETVGLTVVGTVSLVALYRIGRLTSHAVLNKTSTADKKQPTNQPTNQGISFGVNHGVNSGVSFGVNHGTNTGISFGVNTGDNSFISFGVNHGSNSGVSFGVNHGTNTGINFGVNNRAHGTKHHAGDNNNSANFANFASQTDNTKPKQTALTPAQWISGVADVQSQDFAVVGIDGDRSIVWQTAMPERVHDILVQPITDTTPKDRHVTVMGRRPSEHFWVLNSQTGQVLFEHTADSNRHYYGHACYSLDGSWLYITENDTDTFAGKVGVYDVGNGYQKTHEFDTHGIGPHELVMHPDGDTLVIANGGIKTEKASRDELNLDSMQPSLVYLNRHTGQLLEQIYPAHRQMSIRHLSMHANGTLAIGIQFQGERHLSVPLVLTHQLGDDELTPLTLPSGDSKGWYRFHQYIASVAVDSTHDVLAVTSPIGGCVAVFDLCTGVMIDSTDLPDCAGASLWTNTAHPANDTPSFLISDGQGYLTKLSLTADHKLHLDKIQRPFAFDNHLKPLSQ